MFPILLANFSTIAAVTNSSLPPRAYLTLSFISSTEGIFFPMFQESRYCAYPLCHSRCIIYILIPTSNHNLAISPPTKNPLYIFWFLHQTTTIDASMTKSITLYIFWFLHQTTTSQRTCRLWSSCISFDSYIKPQLGLLATYFGVVVYLLIPTSNHNFPCW